MITKIELFESLDLIRLDFCVELNEERNLHKYFGCTKLIAHTHFACCFPHKEMRRSTPTINKRASHTILQSALVLTVGFSKIYCEMRQDFHLCTA